MAGEGARRIGAEFLGSLILSGTVVGSGILAARLADGNAAVALLGNTIATGAMLFVLINALGPISGAHFNPAVTLVMALRKAISPALGASYALAQTVGCIAGVWLAHAMFSMPMIQFSQHVRDSGGEFIGEIAATFALLFTILSVSRWRPEAVAQAVALVITAGYWWTSSTSFANPAITIARAMTDTFAGIRPADGPMFIAGQFMGAVLAWAVWSLLSKDASRA